MIGTSYIPFPPWAIFFCFVPLWLSWLDAKSAREVFVRGWLCQFVLTLIGFNWVAHTVHEFGHLPLVPSFIALLLFCSFANLHIPLAGLLWFWLKKCFPKSGPWTLPALTALGELVFPMIFDWHFGYTWLWAGWPAFHLADLVGFGFLSGLSIFANLWFLKIWQRRDQKRWVLTQIAGFALVFLALNGMGLIHRSNLESPNQSLKILAVQANIGNLEKQVAEDGMGFRDEILHRYFRLTQEGLTEHPDFVLWPETAFPDVLSQERMGRGYPAVLQNFVSQNKINLMTGTYSLLLPEGKITNSLVAVDAGGAIPVEPYHKTVLLAFGEYLPGGSWFPVLYKWLPEVGNFGRGHGPKTFSFAGRKFGAQICYEGLFAWFTRGLANTGAEVLVNVTNDSWYGKWQQPYQHLYMTLARAIEVRRPLIRSTNTGITAAIIADGQILEKSPLHTPWQHTYTIPYRSSPSGTVFQGVGFYIYPATLVFWILGVLIVCRRRIEP